MTLCIQREPILVHLEQELRSSKEMEVCSRVCFHHTLETPTASETIAFTLWGKVLQVGRFTPEAEQLSRVEVEDSVINAINASEASGQSLVETMIKSLGSRQLLAHFQGLNKNQDVTFNDVTGEFEVHPDKYCKFMQSCGNNVVIESPVGHRFVVNPALRDGGTVSVTINDKNGTNQTIVNTPEKLFELLENFLS